MANDQFQSQPCFKLGRGGDGGLAKVTGSKLRVRHLPPPPKKLARVEGDSSRHGRSRRAQKWQCVYVQSGTQAELCGGKEVSLRPGNFGTTGCCLRMCVPAVYSPKQRARCSKASLQTISACSNTQAQPLRTSLHPCPLWRHWQICSGPGWAGLC
jgi:hypothetical protein